MDEAGDAVVYSPTDCTQYCTALGKAECASPQLQHLGKINRLNWCGLRLPVDVVGGFVLRHCNEAGHITGRWKDTGGHWRREQCHRRVVSVKKWLGCLQTSHVTSVDSTDT